MIACVKCGRKKKHRNLEGGVCRTCRRAGVMPGGVLSEDAAKAWNTAQMAGPNAQVEGQAVWNPGDDAPSLQEFESLHHMTQTKVIRSLNVPWEPGSDRVVAYRAFLATSETEQAAEQPESSA